MVVREWLFARGGWLSTCFYCCERKNFNDSGIVMINLMDYRVAVSEKKKKNGVVVNRFNGVYRVACDKIILMVNIVWL